MKKIIIGLSLLIGVASCDTISYKDVKDKYGADGGTISNTGVYSSLLGGRADLVVWLHITDKEGNTYVKGVIVPDSIYWQAYHANYGTYLKLN